MRVVLVFDHPYTAAAAGNVPHHRSFSAALAAAARRGLERSGHDVDLIDLVADGFDPVMRRDDLLAWRRHASVDSQVLDYQRRVAAADHLVFVFPIWWESMPAPTKGFLDKVLTEEFAFRELPRGRGNPFVNLLTGLRGVTVITVMTTPHRIYRWWYGDPVTKILFKGTFNKIGIDRRRLRWLNYAMVAEKSVEEREALLAGTEERFALMRPTGRSSAGFAR